MSQAIRRPELPDIVYLGMNPWDTIRQRAQHLATGLSGYGRVLFVDPITPSVAGALRRALQGGPMRSRGPLVRQLGDGLFRLAPPPGVPLGFDLQACNAINQRLQSILVRRAAERLGFGRPILWIDHPLEADQIGRHGERMVIYNCMDNYPAFWSTVPRRQRLVATLEQRVLARADLVVASSSGLVRRCASARDVRLLPNACDAELFAQALGSECPEELRALRRPLLGYVGTVSHWVDLDLLAEMAATHAEADLVLVGPVENVDIRPYSGLANLHFLGPVAYERVPRYVNAFDVCLIPFRCNDLTADVDPVKAYEYLALGKPVVAVGLPEMARYGDLVHLASAREDAMGVLTQALAEVSQGTGSAMLAERQRVARENTWANRVSAVVEMIRAHLGRPDTPGETSR